MTCIGKVSQGVVKLPPGVDLPDGTAVELILPDANSAAVQPNSIPNLEPGWFSKRYHKYIGGIKNGPPDLAENHDHFAHGAPQKPNS
jgi:hypothetical protein